jgi:hypothetical protein
MKLDGQTLVAAETHVPPCPADTIFVGAVPTGKAYPAVTVMVGAVVSGTSSWPEEMDRLLRGGSAGSIPPARGFDGHTGPIHLHLVLPGIHGTTDQPLMSCGAPGVLDSLALSFRDPAGPRLLFVHEEGRGFPVSLQSHLVTIGADGRLDLVVSAGSLMPPEGSRAYEDHPEWKALLARVAVEANGTLVLNRRLELSPAQPEDLRLLVAAEARPGEAPFLDARIVAAETVPPATLIERLLRLPAGAKVAQASLGGYPGPLSLKLRFPEAADGTAEPLVVTGSTGSGDIVFARCDGPHRFRFGIDHWGYGGPASEAYDVGTADSVHEVVISDGALLPPPGSAAYADHPEWAALRDWLVVALDGNPVLISKVMAYASRPDQITAGFNDIGGSTALPEFSGMIFTVEPASPGWLRQAGKIQP